MQEELKQLEHRIDQAVGLCHRLWQENVALKDQILVTQADNRKLSDKLAVVLERLQTMLESFPPSQEPENMDQSEEQS